MKRRALVLDWIQYSRYLRWGTVIRREKVRWIIPGRDSLFSFGLWFDGYLIVFWLCYLFYTFVKSLALERKAQIAGKYDNMWKLSLCLSPFVFSLLNYFKFNGLLVQIVGETLSIEGNASVYKAVDALNCADNIALLTSTMELQHSWIRGFCSSCNQRSLKLVDI